MRRFNAIQFLACFLVAILPAGCGRGKFDEGRILPIAILNVGAASLEAQPEKADNCCRQQSKQVNNPSRLWRPHTSSQVWPTSLP